MRRGFPSFYVDTTTHRSTDVAMMRRVIVSAIAGLMIWLTVLGFRIVDEGGPSSGKSADVAIVLGAAVYHSRPSPVFEERIRHGIKLYKAAKVRKLLFTGGRGKGAAFAEAIVAHDYARARGVPPEDALTETVSRTTKQNLVEARRLMQRHSLRSALIVTDPLHTKRALRMATGLDIAAAPSPTLTSRYRSWRSRAGFLLREIYFYNVYLLTGH